MRLGLKYDGRKVKGRTIMAGVLTIPKHLTKRGELVIVPKDQFQKMAALARRLSREEKDTDEAIRVFEKERRAGKLKNAAKFSEILR